PLLAVSASEGNITCSRLYEWTKECAGETADCTNFRYSQGEIAVSSDANAHNSTDLMELWKDWNETTIRMWSRILDSGKGAYGNPFGLYNFWMRSAGV